jgi:hypothetical protein
MSHMKLIGTVSAVAAIFMLGGCVAVVPLAVASGIGVLDVSAFHGCIGIAMSNWLPWTTKYNCEAKSVSVAKADASPTR